ncbi:hypothetical protein RUM43_007101 [Polyplax serrata]|uniref:Uncharacterized protein n=1 Tax=Polyplax serrata TaxID=468196 RepID=A0AAN8PLJ7_POLSC
MSTPNNNYPSRKFDRRSKFGSDLLLNVSFRLLDLDTGDRVGREKKVAKKKCQTKKRLRIKIEKVFEVRSVHFSSDLIRRSSAVTGSEVLHRGTIVVPENYTESGVSDLSLERSANTWTLISSRGKRSG